ncbi:MAG TPA: glycosyltransferase family 4 protein, partial [Acidobacteriota bacterium]|nr:glycosyltransferase family 4 protein [Acidobacteriota bacterium]
MKRVRVLEMIDRPFLGGGQVTVLTLARGLDKEKFEVLVASEDGGPLVDELAKIGIRHVPVRLGKFSGLSSAGALATVLRENAVDILHTHGGIAGLYGRLAARKAGTPAVVHTVHGLHYLHYRNPAAKRAFIVLERRLSRSTDAVVFVSEADMERAARLRLALPPKARLIRNGVPPIPQARLRDPAAVRAELRAVGRPLVVAVSRLHRQKGVTYLLRAVPLVRAEIPNVRIVVAGGGPLADRLGAEVKALRVGDNVALLGERKDALSILAAADVFVLSSLWEGLPYVLVEAAALGKPVVATDIDGVREVIRSGATGVLVPPRDPGALAAAILLLLKDRAFAGGL